MPGQCVDRYSDLFKVISFSAALLAGTALAGPGAALGQSAFLPLLEMNYLGGVSADGSVLVGSSRGGGEVEDNGDEQAILIRFQDGTYMVVPLGTLGGRLSTAHGVSADGTTVVGDSDDETGYFLAFRWQEETGMVSLGTLFSGFAQAQSYGRGTSDDGRTIVGYSTRPGFSRGFAWIEGSDGGVSGNEQMHQLSALSGGYNQTKATAVSGDGRYATGHSDADATTSRAVRWDLSGLASGDGDIVLNLGSLTGMGGWSEASGISADGMAIVGTSEDADGRSRAFLWREGADHGQPVNVQMLDLGTLGGQESWGTGISRNGVWVVGTSEVQDATEHDLPHAFRWSEASGMESVVDWLGRHGVTVDSWLADAKFISDDGSIVSGHYNNIYNQTRVYLARVADGVDPGMMDVEDYHRSLAANAVAVSSGEFLSWLPLNGAHHRPLMLQPGLGGGACVWTTGDFAHHGGDRANLALAEAGACVDVLDGAVRLGLGSGTSHSWQSLDMGGSTRFGGQYLVGEADWKPNNLPLLFSLTGVAGRWDVNVQRGYLNGAATDYSFGSTAAHGAALRARVDWLAAATLGNTTINPFASVGVSALHMDGYTESGGAFPAIFDARSHTAREVRLGVTAVTALGSDTTLSTSVEAVHRNADAAHVSGQVVGIFGFNLGGGTQASTWLRTGLELDHRLAENTVISASLHAATQGRDASISGSLGLRAQF